MFKGFCFEVTSSSKAAMCCRSHVVKSNKTML